MGQADTKLSYRWVIIGAGALMTCVGIGAMFSLAVETGYSRAGISSAMTLNFLTMGVADGRAIGSLGKGENSTG